MSFYKILNKGWIKIMSKYLFRINIIVMLLLLFLTPFTQAVPDVTSYWGSVKFDSVPQSNASVTVIDSSGNTVASATSNSNAQYAVDVYWNKLSTQTGESLTFKVNGKTAITRTIDPKGESIMLDLSASSTTPTLVDSYLPPGATPAERKAGLIRAMDDYFDNGTLTKAELLSVLDSYFA
jgi:hypothetical protein